MDLHVTLFFFLYVGKFLFVDCTPFFFKPRSQVVNAVLNLYCGVTEAPTTDDEPLRFSPWMVILTHFSEKGKDTIVDCGATLISGKHAITSDDCLRKEKSMPTHAILGAPNVRQLKMGAKRPIKKISILVSDNRIAVLQFGAVIFSNSVSPICLETEDLTGIYATVGYAPKNKAKMRTGFGKKVAYLRMQEYCKTNGFCAEVLPVEVFRHNVLIREDPRQWKRFFLEQERNIRLIFSEHERCIDFCGTEDLWEMETREIQEGAPLLIKEDSYWYLKGIMIDKNTDQNNDNKNDTRASNPDGNNNNNEGQNTKPETNKDEGMKTNSDNKEPTTITEGTNEGDAVTTENGNKVVEDTTTESIKQNEETTEAGEQAVLKRKRRSAISEGKGVKNYDLYFAKLTSHVVDELKGMFSLLEYL